MVIVNRLSLTPTMMLRRIAAVAILLAVLLQSRAQADSFTFSVFEQYLESLRAQAGIPGLSAAIVQDQQIVWERGFGFEDLEAGVRATPDTPYVVSDLSQIFASILLLQCAEQGRLTLDDPMVAFTPAIPEPGAMVKHVLAHASEGTPGAIFKYDPARYAALTPVVERCRAMPYRKAIAQQLLERLAMVDSVPGQDIATAAAAEPLPVFGHAVLDRYNGVLQRLAKPYRVDRDGRASRSEYPVQGMNAALGLVSTVRDLARFDAALDRDALLNEDLLLKPETVALAWTNAMSPSGTPLPTGLGWFAQTDQGQRVVWHFGVAVDAFSSLIVKLPDRKLTLILLANSDGLTAPFRLSDGDVTSSFFARIFLRIFG